MQPFKIQIKLFAERDLHVDAYVPVFHRWIRESLVPELLIDVADYAHVPDGPAVALIGHESDYVLDRADGRLGLLYVNKRGNVDLPAALRRTLRAAELLNAETSLSERITFRTDELLLRVADRLNAPNNNDTYERLLPELRAGLESLYGSSRLELSRVGTERELFGVQVRVSEAPSFAELAKRATERPS
jgi:hypothetical protein